MDQYLILGIKDPAAAGRIRGAIEKGTYAKPGGVGITVLGMKGPGLWSADLVADHAIPTEHDVRPAALVAGAMAKNPGIRVFKWDQYSPKFHRIQTPALGWRKSERHRVAAIPGDLNAVIVIDVGSDQHDMVTTYLNELLQGTQAGKPDMWGLESQDPRPSTDATTGAPNLDQDGRSSFDISVGTRTVEVLLEPGVGPVTFNGTITTDTPSLPPTFRRPGFDWDGYRSAGEIKAPSATSIETRYVDGRCPRRLRVGAPSWLLVRVAIEPVDEKGALKVDLPTDEGGVHVMLVTSPKLVLLSERHMEIVVPKGRDSGWHGWQVQALEPGVHGAVACFHRQGELIGILRFTVDSGDTADGDMVPARAALRLGTIKKKQGLLVVRQEGDDLWFVGLDGDPLGERHPVIDHACFPKSKIRELGEQRKALDRMARGMDQDWKEDQVQAREFGAHLFGLLPKDIKDFLSAGSQRWDTLKIEGGNEEIAWELLREPGKGSTPYAHCLPFLRWRLGCEPPAATLSLGNPVLVLGSSLDGDDPMDQGKEQIHALQNRLGARPEVTTRAELEEVLDTADFDLLHYAGHMTTDGRLAAMHVGNGPFTQARLVDIHANALRRRPLVFLNACSSHQAAPSLAGLMGWCDRFLEKGAGAFVGTSWTLRATTATAFAEHFYAALLDGPDADLATATSAARKGAMSTRDDWSSLAYAVYGHPDATVVAEPAAT